jgi:hypothetical protein
VEVFKNIYPASSPRIRSQNAFQIDLPGGACPLAGHLDVNAPFGQPQVNATITPNSTSSIAFLSLPQLTRQERWSKKILKVMD